MICGGKISQLIHAWSKLGIYTLQGTITYPKREVQKIIDSKVPCVVVDMSSSQEGKDVAFLLMEMENAGPSNIGW